MKHVAENPLFLKMQPPENPDVLFGGHPVEESY